MKRLPFTFSISNRTSRVSRSMPSPPASSLALLPLQLLLPLLLTLPLPLPPLLLLLLLRNANVLQIMVFLPVLLEGSRRPHCAAAMPALLAAPQQ
mmetsp:Transcript_29963/g.95751  ORF Transcript_29963/g.95751 Transcript_29963/m.95751 type:complete len:95 (+) Transcript_29963:702-986(+)